MIELFSTCTTGVTILVSQILSSLKYNIHCRRGILALAMSPRYIRERVFPVIRSELVGRGWCWYKCVCLYVQTFALQ